MHRQIQQIHIIKEWHLINFTGTEAQKTILMTQSYSETSLVSDYSSLAVSLCNFFYFSLFLMFNSAVLSSSQILPIHTGIKPIQKGSIIFNYIVFL